MAWPAAPTTLATTPQLSSPPRGSSMQPQSSTSQVETLPSTGAWAVGRPFALPSITPSGSMVRRHGPNGEVPPVLTHQRTLTPTSPPPCPTSERAHAGFKGPRVGCMFAQGDGLWLKLQMS